MAKPRTLSVGNFKIFVGDTDSPGVFTAPCGFTQKALILSAANSETNVPDCDDPEAAAWTERGVTALSAQVTGQGVMAMGSLELWREWFMSAAPRWIRVEFDDTGGPDRGYYEGQAILSSLGHSVALGSDGSKTQLQVTVDSSGEWTWTDAA